MVSALVTLTSANMDMVYKDMVTRSHQVGGPAGSGPGSYRLTAVVFVCFQEIAMQQIMTHLDSIRKDMVILEKSEFSNLRSENTVPPEPSADGTAGAGSWRLPVGFSF